MRGFVIALLLCFGTGASASEFLWLSDIHFNPVADPKLVDALADASVEEWPGILNSSASHAFSGFGSDANWPLLASSLEAIRKTAPNVEFTVVTGDILVHRFREKFQSAARQHDDAAFRRFTAKTLQFVAAQLGTIAPGKPVLLTLGNNDTDCGDYAMQPGGPFLEDGRAVVRKLLAPIADESSLKDWAELGSYGVPLPALKHRQAIVLNSVYFSARYQNTCSANAGDPGMEEMRWLEKKLAEAKQHKDKVWLILHIPPGIDGYATAHRKADGPPLVRMWKPAYTAEFEKLLQQYRGTVDFSFAGHEHMDDFRLVGNSVMQMTPGLSPVVGQNPGFRVVSFRPNGALSDEATYFLSNLDGASKGSAPEWKLEYRFAETWGVRAINAQSFRKLYREAAVKPASRQRWSLLYSVSRLEGGSLTPQTFPQLYCASGNISDDAFTVCVSGF